MRFTIDRIDHIVLNVKDVEITAAWYQRVLGMEREEFGPHNRTALKFGLQNKDVNVNIFEIGEFKALIQRYNVRAVPTSLMASAVRAPTTACISSLRASTKPSRSRAETLMNGRRPEAAIDRPVFEGLLPR